MVDPPSPKRFGGQEFYTAGEQNIGGWYLK